MPPDDPLMPGWGVAIAPAPWARSLVARMARRYMDRERAGSPSPRHSQNPWGWSQSRLEQMLGEAMYARTDLAGRFKSQIQIGPNRVDFAFPVERLIVEADGVAFHSGIRARWHDWGRDRMAAKLGWRTVRFKQWEIYQSPEHCALRVSRALPNGRS